MEREKIYQKVFLLSFQLIKLVLLLQDFEGTYVWLECQLITGYILYSFFFFVISNQSIVEKLIFFLLKSYLNLILMWYFSHYRNFLLFHSQKQAFNPNILNLASHEWFMICIINFSLQQDFHLKTSYLNLTFMKRS